MLKSVIKSVRFLMCIFAVFCSALTLYLGIRILAELSEEDEYDSDEYYYDD